MIKNILTVCVGNICRSPMAEALLRQQLPNANVSSAGIGALVGHPADPSAIRLMESRNLDISRHRARQINLEMCQQAEIILVMENSHRDYILRNYSFTQGKVFRLGEHFKTDIPDPYRQANAVFEQALVLIDEGAKAWSDRIARL